MFFNFVLELLCCSGMDGWPCLQSCFYFSASIVLWGGGIAMFVNFFSTSFLQWDGWLAMFAKLFLFQHIFSAVGWMDEMVGHVCKVVFISAHI